MGSSRRRIEPGPLEVEPSTAGASGGRDLDVLANSLSLRQAREVVSLLLSLDDPARRWTLEAIAIVSPTRAEYARALKEGCPNVISAQK